MQIINTTPHPITFRYEDGEEFTVEPWGVLINARVVEECVSISLDGTAIVRTRFEPDPKSEQDLDLLQKNNPDAIIVGSVIAAQAYPGRVFGLTPAPGFERVPVNEKRMNPLKFVTF